MANRRYRQYSSETCMQKNERNPRTIITHNIQFNSFIIITNLIHFPPIWKAVTSSFVSRTLYFISFLAFLCMLLCNDIFSGMDRLGLKFKLRFEIEQVLFRLPQKHASTLRSPKSFEKVGVADKDIFYRKRDNTAKEENKTPNRSSLPKATYKRTT